MRKSPIVLFVYARLDHTRRTVQALLRNPEACEHDLIVYSDAPRSEADESQVEAVRNYLREISGFRSTTIVHRIENYGLSKSIIAGVSETLSNHEAIIVLEDDMVTSPHFLAYMNDALERFANHPEVISVHGYVYPVREKLPEAFFLTGADCWGWATWRRGWSFFNPDGQYLLDEIKRQKLQKEFNFNGAYDYTGMLQSQINGRNDSWAIRWYASAFLARKLTLYPGRSLVQNIGNDNSGTHCGAESIWDVKLSTEPISLNAIPVESSEQAYRSFEKNFRTVTSIGNKLFLKVKKYINAQQFFPGFLGLFTNPFYFARKNLFSAIRENSYRIQGDLVDIGCGRKPYRNLFNVRSYRGLDIDSQVVRFLGVADDYYDGESFPYEGCKFDSVLCNQVLEHVFNPDFFLNEINRVLKPEGKLLLTVPFVWDEHEQPFDFARYSSFGLRALLERNGFKIISHKKLGADATTLFQLANAYFFKISRGWPKLGKFLLGLTVIPTINIFGIVAGKVLPKNPDLFLDHIVLAEKV